ARRVGRQLSFRSPRTAAPMEPASERVSAGPLAGRELLSDRSGTGARDDMLSGRFEAEIYGVIAQSLPARGGIVWDVGAHIGFHTLRFSALGGAPGAGGAL